MIEEDAIEKGTVNYLILYLLFMLHLFVPRLLITGLVHSQAYYESLIYGFYGDILPIILELTVYWLFFINTLVFYIYKLIFILSYNV